MTTSIGQRGQVVIPKAIRASHEIKPGDDFEVLTDDDDVDLILLRRILSDRKCQSLVKHLLSCPDKEPLTLPVRRPEPMRKVKL